MNAMIKTVAFAGLLLALTMGKVATAAEAADAAALEAVDQAWETAYNAGDVEALVALYDAQAILQPPGAPSEFQVSRRYSHFPSFLTDTERYLPVSNTAPALSLTT